MKRFLPRAPKRRACSLGELETAVMEVLWQHGQLSGREVYDKVAVKREIALTTVLTILNRLSKKGLVRKEPGEKVFLFRPTLSREQWQTAVSRDLLLQALSFSPQTVLSTFADILTSLPAEEFSELIARVRRKKDESIS